MAAFYTNLKNRRSKDGVGSSSRGVKSRDKDTSAASHFFETSTWIESGLFFVFSALVVIIAFLGEEPKGPRIILNQAAPTRIVAEFPFKYESFVEEEIEAAAIRAQVPPVFQRSFEPFEKFRNFTADLSSSIAKTQINFESKNEEVFEGVFEAELEATTEAVIERSKLNIEANTILRLTEMTEPKERSSLINDALSVLKNIYEDGIYSSNRTETKNPQVTVIQLVDESGRANLPNARSINDARVTLRVRLNALSSDSETARLLFEIFGAGLKPNLFYSETATQRAIDRAVAKLEPRFISFSEGDTLVEPGKLVNEADLERLSAYKEAELQQGNRSLVFNELFLGHDIIRGVVVSD